MKILFDVIGVICLLASLGTCAISKSVMHESVGAILFLVGVVALGLGALLDALARIERTLRSMAASPPAPIATLRTPVVAGSTPRPEKIKRDKLLALIIGVCAVAGGIAWYMVAYPPK